MQIQQAPFSIGTLAPTFAGQAIGARLLPVSVISEFTTAYTTKAITTTQLPTGLVETSGLGINDLILPAIVTYLLTGALVFYMRGISPIKVANKRLWGFPTAGFPKSVVGGMSAGLRIFNNYNELDAIWETYPHDILEEDPPLQKTDENGNLSVTITRKPSGKINFFPTYAVTYTFSDEGRQLIKVDISKTGGWLGKSSFSYIPNRKLPPAAPPKGKIARTKSEDIGDDAISLKVHPQAHAEGDEIKIFPTRDDFKLAFGAKPFNYWHNGSTAALIEFETPRIFSNETTSDKEYFNKLGLAYSTGILEIVYDMEGNPVERLEPYKDYIAYETRYNYGRDGELLRAVIVRKKIRFEHLGDSGAPARLLGEYEVLWEYRPNFAPVEGEGSSAAGEP